MPASDIIKGVLIIELNNLLMVERYVRKNQNSKLHFGHYELSVQFYQYYTVVAETLHQYI
jgi:hypothetical protein